tara:strand:+ start:388 stop:1065 length:678 start_codon:yes stop_codon:yes gene_type:complete
MSITEIKKALVGTFQGMLKNIVSLANDSTLEKDYKVLKVGEKNTPIEISEDNVKINNSVVLTEKAGGTSRWSVQIGGYRTNNTSTSTYYTFYRPWYDNWANGDSSPTSINVYDSSSVAWTAPANCTITNFRVVGYCNDTGATDPFKFYIYKGTTAHDATSTSLTAIANTDAIECAAALRAFNESKDISSGNSISAGEQLYVFLKKDSNTGNQDLYFSITISGEYS